MVKQNDVRKVLNTLKGKRKMSEQVDEMGRNVLHWAASRGYESMT